MYTTNYKLFRAPRNRNLKRKTWIAHTIWNYFLGWQRMRYALGLPYMSYREMSREFTILRNAHPDMFAHWRELDSWAARQILERLDEGYQRFFRNSQNVRRGSDRFVNLTRSRCVHLDTSLIRE